MATLVPRACLAFPMTRNGRVIGVAPRPLESAGSSVCPCQAGYNTTTVLSSVRRESAAHLQPSNCNQAGTPLGRQNFYDRPGRPTQICQRFSLYTYFSEVLDIRRSYGTPLSPCLRGCCLSYRRCRRLPRAFRRRSRRRRHQSSEATADHIAEYNATSKTS